MTSTPGVIVGSIHYDIRSTDEDNNRRCAYFKNRSNETKKQLFKDCTVDDPKAVLLDDEIRLLEDLHIDDGFQENHAYDLYIFLRHFLIVKQVQHFH